MVTDGGNEMLMVELSQEYSVAVTSAARSVSRLKTNCRDYMLLMIAQ